MESETIKEVVEASKDVVSRVGNETVNLIMSKLEALAAGMGTTVEYLWGITVKQAAVEGWAGVIKIVLTVGIAAVYGLLIKMFLAKNWYSEDEEYSSKYADDPKCIVSWVVTGIMGVIVIVITLDLVIIGFSETITCFINPEYWAFETILRKVK